MFGREAANERVSRIETFENPDRAAAWMSKLETILTLLHARADAELDAELNLWIKRSSEPTASQIKVGDFVLKTSNK
jgi:hypothetical protein